MDFCVETVSAIEPDIAAGTFDRVYFCWSCLLGHEYRACDSELIHRVCDRRTVIAAGCGHPAGFAIFFRQRQQLVECTTQLEGSCVLQILEFEVDICASQLAEIG